MKIITKKHCLKTALECTTKNEWHVLYGSEYLFAKKVGEIFFKKCTKHMKLFIRHKHKARGIRIEWNHELILDKAKEFDRRSDWARYSRGSYEKAKDFGTDFYNKCTSHMNSKPYAKKNFWNKNNILKEAKKYKTSKEWRRNSSSSHAIATRLGKTFLAKCTSHFDKPDYKRTWKNQDILEEAQKYKSKVEWHDKSTLSYRTALKTPKLFKECVKHMKIPHNIKKWTDKKVIRTALKYGSKSIWIMRSSGSYSYSLKRGKTFHSKCCAHMKKTKDSLGEIISGKILSYTFKKTFKKVKFKGIGEIDRYAVISLNDKKIRLGIEHQGESHYKFVPYYHKTIEGFEYRKRLDVKKYRNSRKNGIILLRIKDLRNFYKFNEHKIANRFAVLFKLNRIPFNRDLLNNAVKKSLRLTRVSLNV